MSGLDFYVSAVAEEFANLETKHDNMEQGIEKKHSQEKKKKKSNNM